MAEREEHWADATGQLDHRLYMASKTRKLDHAQGECEAARGTWFRGCYIWFNGYMEVRGSRGGVLRPTELQALVRAGGGLVENVDVPRVTHIVAATLPPRKVQELMSRKVGFSKPVVTPSWVVDCDAEQRLVPVGNYIVYKQSPSVAHFFPPTKRRRTSTPEEEEEEEEDGAPEAHAGGGDGGGAGATPPEEEDGDDEMLARLKRKALETVQEEDARPSSQDDAAEARRRLQCAKDEALAREVTNRSPSVSSQLIEDEAYARRVAEGRTSTPSESSQCRNDEALARRLEQEQSPLPPTGDSDVARRLADETTPSPARPPAYDDDDEEADQGDVADWAGEPIFRRVERFSCLGPRVATWLTRVDPASREPVILLTELLAFLVQAGRLEDVASIVRLVEDHAACADDAWQQSSTLLSDVADELVREKYGGPLVARAGRVRPDFAFFLTP